MRAKQNAGEVCLSRPWRRKPLAVFSICLAFTLQHSAAQAADLPAFEVSYSPQCGEKIKALGALAGPDWRAVAEKNRKPELRRLSKEQIIALMRKYADTGHVDCQVPLAWWPDK